MRKFISVLLSAAVIMTVIAGCGTKDSTKTSDTTTGDTKSTVASTETPAKAVNLTYMTWDYADRKASTDSFIQNVKDKFNITIELLNFPTDQYQATAKTRLSANDIPDLVSVHRILDDLTLYGYKLKADTFADISDIEAISEFMPEVVDARKIDGKLYYEPISINALGVLYNKKVFNDLNLTIPQNIDEFTAVLDKIKAAGIVPIGGGFKDSWTTQIIPFQAVGQYVMANDADNMKKMWTGELKWSSPEFKKALQLQLDFAKKGYFAENFLGSDVNTASALVANGKAAMLICGNWQYTAIKAANEDADIGFFAAPLNANGEKLAMCTDANGGICINAGSKNLKAAKDALNYYLSKENQTLVINEVKGVPVNKGVILEDPFAKDIVAAMATASVLPTFSYFSSSFKPAAITFAPDKEFQGLLANSGTVEDLVKRMDGEIEKALK